MPVEIAKARRPGLLPSLFAVAIAGFASAPSAAPGTPLGPPVKVADGRALDVAARRDGGFVLLFANGEEKLHLMRFAADGSAVGPATTVAETAYLIHAHLAVDAEGGTVVVWQQGTDGIWARRFDAGGIATGGAVRLEPTWTSTGGIGISMDADGDFAVTWQTHTIAVPFNSYAALWSTNVYARAWRADLTPRRAKAWVASRLSNWYEGDAPAVAMDDDGDFVVAWATPSAKSDVRVRRYWASGTARGAGRTVAADTTIYPYDRDNVEIASSAGGDFTVGWADRSGLHGRRYGADGAPSGPAFLVDGDSVHSNELSTDAAGHSAWLWHEVESDQAFVRLYAADGSARGPAFTVPDAQPSAFEPPQIAALPGGDCAVAWTENLSPNPPIQTGIYVQRFSGS